MKPQNSAMSGLVGGGSSMGGMGANGSFNGGPPGRNSALYGLLHPQPKPQGNPFMNYYAGLDPYSRHLLQIQGRAPGMVNAPMYGGGSGVGEGGAGSSVGGPAADPGYGANSVGTYGANGPSVGTYGGWGGTGGYGVMDAFGDIGRAAQSARDTIGIPGLAGLGMIGGLPGAAIGLGTLGVAGLADAAGLDSNGQASGFGPEGPSGLY